MPPPQYHHLAGNAGTEIPSNLVFFDCESYERKPRSKSAPTLLSWRLACAIGCRLERGKITRRDVLQTKSKEELWAWLEGRQLERSPLWVFAHNLHFDLTQACFWEELEKGTYTLGPIAGNGADPRVRGKRPWRGKMCLEPNPCFLCVMGKRGLVNFVDTSNYWPTALYKIGNDFNLPKGDMPEFKHPDKVWFPYCLRDCEIIELAMTQLLLRWKAADLGVFQKTAAALSMQSYRHTQLQSKHNPKGYKITIAHNEEHSELERKAYYGGYTSPFYVGYLASMTDPVPAIPSLTTGQLVPCPVGPIIKVDCNSLYPFVMHAGKFPFKRVGFADGISPRELHNKTRCQGATAEVKILTWDDEYPLRYENHLQYATGNFWTCLCGAELERALVKGHVEQVGRVIYYSVDHIFREWSEYWLKVKELASKNDDVAGREFAKLIGNSLYGKWAQISKGWRDTPAIAPQKLWGQWVEIDADTLETVTCRSIGGHTQSRQEGDELPHVFPAISAFIAAASREYMRDIRALCPEKTVYYQGVDSLILSLYASSILEKHGLIDEDKAGCFKVEDFAEEGEIIACNHYRLDKETIWSGHWGKAKVDKWGIGHAQLWQGIQATLSGRPDGTIALTPTELKKEVPYHKGILQADNWLKFRHLINLPEELQEPPRKSKRTSTPEPKD